MTEEKSGPDPEGPGAAPGHELPPTEGTLDRALTLVSFLREHCPWDRDQTPRSLIPYLLEESHETAHAIEAGDRRGLEGELGDLLLNVAFQIVIAEEDGRFSRESVVERLEEKMKRRHPHLFGRGDRQEWEALKARERPPEESVLSGLARGLDPLQRAHRMQEKAAGVGFDWDDASGALEKVEEELDEVAGAMELHDEEHLREEVGDLLFSVVNLARLLGVHPTTALGRANAKFQKRFQRLEELARERGVLLDEASLTELDALWEELKSEP